MITKISKLKSFGIFQDFAWNDLTTFKRKNLIYGLNYSGKTTLSKLFQNLEFKDKNRHFQEAEFEIITTKEDTNTSHNQDYIENFDFEVKVFNAQYIKRIFTWDIPNSDFKPISFYLGDPSGELAKKIKQLDKQITQLENIRDNRYQIRIDKFNNYTKSGGRFSAKAKDIRKNYLNNKLDQNELNKGVIEQITNAIKDDLNKHILSEKIKDKTKEEAVAENTFETQKDDYNFNENLDTLKTNVKSILEDTAPKSISFPELDDDKALFDWVQTGIRIHENERKCKFCTKELPDDRINNLNSYYSKKLQEIQKAIKDTKDAITTERNTIDDITFPDKKNLGSSFQNDYQKAIKDFKESVKKYKSQLTTLEKDLKRKESDYFNNINATEIESISLENDFDEINKSVKAHNDWISEFDENKKKALDKILNHYVAEYLKNENYLEKEEDKDKASSIIENLNSRIQSSTTDKINFETELKSNVKGQEELNTTLKVLLHRNDIKIEIRNDKFTLERSGFPANNLSEGEKSAIAFAYFLTELKALRNDNPPKLPNTIIFIDDPISSLDSNHIFQVRSLLQNFFKKKDDDFLQLFISTHNFDFFSMMMDSTELFKNQKKTEVDFYMIKRQDNNASTITDLPENFKKHNSEYASLFSVLKEYHSLENKEDFKYTILLPNTMRRFLELYTSMKFPTSNSLESRIKEVFSVEDDTYHNTKLLHWFSHQNQLEKIQQHDDKIFQIEDAISELMKHIEQNDKLHWQGLNGI
ncbi:AAA family ATPase [Winogradskyella sp. SYSU M77433]|uniref:AAA family ATPase n=1 Tax=Winogradskyella sp. SYSU M77433 TaxID=3042722 RepID=UPI002481976C|nr:AAA family ATPase [Winogradskyella sp. SYSU M77433]MDH7914617.1 AAA family ATPase [Winogradskyella sp. SYSU M77433]